MRETMTIYIYALSEAQEDGNITTIYKVESDSADDEPEWSSAGCIIENQERMGWELVSFMQVAPLDGYAFNTRYAAVFERWSETLPEPVIADAVPQPQTAS